MNTIIAWVKLLLGWIHRFRWILVAVAVALVIAGVVAARALSGELEEKFHAAHDSVPTRVYSSVYWLRPGTGASAEELRFRLHERDYREVHPGEERGPGTYSLELDEQKRPTILTVHTNDFLYPDVATEVIFGANPKTTSAKYTTTWSGGAVTKVMGPDGNELTGGFALEPILVARLNEGNKEARKTVPLAQIPHTLLEGIVLTEDQRFLEHIGFDPRGIARSVWVAIRSRGHDVQGASTITQQLARGMFLSNRRTLTRKVQELFVSLWLEIHFSKDEILEKYLNEVYFGQSGNVAIHGVAEAAKFYYNKQLDDLTIAEQSLLAGIIKGPPYYSPFRHMDRAKGRQEIVLGKMRDAGVITGDQYKAALTETIHLAKASSVQNRAPYFTDMVQAQLLKDLPEQEGAGQGYTIFSTLDTYYQQLAEKSVSDGVSRVEANIAKYVELEAKRKAKLKKKAAPKVDESAEERRLRGSGSGERADPLSRRGAFLRRVELQPRAPHEAPHRFAREAFRVRVRVDQRP
jgi:penicillin-binding protein 1B